MSINEDCPYDYNQLKNIVRTIKRDNECPVKYAYMGIGAQRFSIVSNHPKYRLGRIEKKLLENKAINIVHNMGKPQNINIIDLGCGDGTKAIVFLISLLKLGRRIRYFPVDISKSMLMNAVSTISNSLLKDYQKIEIGYPKDLDFEKSSEPLIEFTDKVRTNQFPMNLILFLGHTLGNASSQRKVLDNISESMEAEDFCLFGVELYDDRWKNNVEEEYDFPEMNDLVYTPMEYIGVPRDIGHFDPPKFDLEYQEVQLKFRVDKPWEDHIADRMLRLRKDKLITLARSHKFSEKSLGDDLNQSRFSVINSFSDSESKFMLSLTRFLPVRE
jgi:uncharacterized SAM-dependent methyltransferase